MDKDIKERFIYLFGVILIFSPIRTHSKKKLKHLISVVEKVEDQKNLLGTHSNTDSSAFVLESWNQPGGHSSQ